MIAIKSFLLNDPEKTVAVILQYNTAFDPFGLPHAIKYGKVHEADALKLFIRGEKDKHKNFSVHQTGLHVFKDVTFLSASPDGMISCDCFSELSPLEIKCLYSSRSLNPKVAALQSENILEISDGGLQLKKSVA